MSARPFFSIHKQFLVHLHDSISQKINSAATRPVFRHDVPVSIDVVEEHFSTEFLISLFCHHLKINEAYEHAHIILEKRRMSEIPVCSPGRDFLAEPHGSASCAKQLDMMSTSNEFKHKAMVKYDEPELMINPMNLGSITSLHDSLCMNQEMQTKNVLVKHQIVSYF